MYNVNIINLFQPSLDAESPLDRIDPYRDRARSSTSASLKELRRLLALQETRHGWMDAITLILHPISVVSFGSLEEISRNYPDPISLEKSEQFKGVQTCLRALSSLSSYSYYAQPLFRLLTQKCQTLGVRVPSEVQKTLDYYISDEWTKNAVNLVSSQYVADMRKTTKDAERISMDAIISEWEELSLDEAGKRQSGAN